MQALQRIQVVELSPLTAKPFAAQTLADVGADGIQLAAAGPFRHPAPLLGALTQDLAQASAWSERRSLETPHV